MKYLIVQLVLSGLVLNATAQKQSPIDSILRSGSAKRQVYVLCRATLSKKGLIANTFNCYDTNITHVAIGLTGKAGLDIYSVEDVYSTQGQLFKKDVNGFIDVAGLDYLGLWVADVRKQEFIRIKRAIRGFMKRKIKFDYSFLLNNGDALYCSEFCALVLLATGAKRFLVQPKGLRLEGLYKTCLQREILEYFPPDFFRELASFRLIYEKQF